MATMSERLKWTRQQFGYTQTELAKRADVALSTIRRIEQDKFNLRLDTIAQLAKALHVREGWLVYGDDPMLSITDMAEDEHYLVRMGRETPDLAESIGVSGPWLRQGEAWVVDRKYKDRSRNS